ncbi:MAG TPA: DUF4350 domain-containing protein [Streptosporangiaceae bacterium]|nr:DUF4350 domain-containing protein [Streptosporangiaceae bacterium]
MTAAQLSSPADAGPASPGEDAPGGTQEAAPRQRGRAGRAGRAGPAWRRSRLPLALIGMLLLAGLLIAMLSPRPQVNSYLDPASGAPNGANALTDILGERGFDVVSTYAPSDALSAVGKVAVRQAEAGRPGRGPDVTLVITSPGLLTAGQRRQLAGARADLFLVAPGPAVLAALAPGIFVAHQSRIADGTIERPACGLRQAALAGSANVGGLAYQIPAGATGCYPAGGHPSVVRYAAGGRTITIVGSGAALTDGDLAGNGNAALALNLLSAHREIVWLTPEPPAAVSVAPATGPHRSAPSLLPAGVWLLILQLLIVVALAALWRARRFGPLITERLPVVVRASETVEGHARLYQSRRARDRAAAALRQAMLGRTLPALGLPPGAAREAVTDALAARSRLSRPEIEAIVDGQAPTSDADLVRLARNLDELEKEVRAQ